MSTKPTINAEGAVSFQYHMVPIEGIVVEQRNNNRFGTYTVEDIQDLLEDLDKGKGIRSPVVCRPLSDRRPLLVEGYRRYAAIKYWNSIHKPSESMKLPVIICEMNDEEALESNVGENVRRRNLTPMDSAIGIRNLSNMGKDDNEIKGIFRKSLAWVKQTRKLLSLDRDLQNRIHKDLIPATVGIELSEMSLEDRGIVVAAIENDFKGKFSLTNLHKAAREVGAIGDGETARPVVNNNADSTDLLASSHTKGHTPKRKQRTVREINDYLDRWELNDTITQHGRSYIKLQMGFISGKTTDGEMDQFIVSTFGVRLSHPVPHQVSQPQ